MKLHVYISNNESYLRGSYDTCFTVFEDCDFAKRCFPESIYVCEIEIPEIDITDVTQSAVTALEVEITDARAAFQAKLDGLETRKQNLLAITHQGAA